MSTRTTLSDLNAYVAVRDRLRTPEHPTVGAFLICMARAQGNVQHAADLSRKFTMPGLDRLVRSVIEAGDTTSSGWASQLKPAATMLSGLFMDLLRPREILGRIPGVRTGPFDVAVPSETAGGVYQWIGEGAAARVGSLTVGSATVNLTKLGGILPVTRELLKFSPTAAELIQGDLAKGAAKFADTAFLSNTAAVANVQPAGILNSVGATGNASGTSAANFRADLKTLISAIDVDNPAELAVLMSTTDALNLSLMGNEFPNLTVNGGDLGGLPVVTSEAVQNRLILLHGPSLIYADSGAEIAYSEEASIEMDDAPVEGESSPFSQGTALKSFFQNNLGGFRVTRFVGWKFGVSGRIKWINLTNYGG